MGSPQDQPGRDPRRFGTATEGSAVDQGTGYQGTGDARRAEAAVPRPAPGYDDLGAPRPGPTRPAVGLTNLAAVLMMLSGIWGFLEGLAAIIRGSFFLRLPDYAYSISAAGWGWTHLVVSVLVFAIGLALMLKDTVVTRVVGVIIVSASAIANFIFIPYSPVWSIVMIAADVLVLWALLVPRHAWHEGN